MSNTVLIVVRARSIVAHIGEDDERANDWFYCAGVTFRVLRDCTSIAGRFDQIRHAAMVAAQDMHLPVSQMVDIGAVRSRERKNSKKRKPESSRQLPLL